MSRWIRLGVTLSLLGAIAPQHTAAVPNDPLARFIVTVIERGTGQYRGPGDDTSFAPSVSAAVGPTFANGRFEELTALAEYTQPLPRQTRFRLTAEAAQPFERATSPTLEGFAASLSLPLIVPSTQHRPGNDSSAQNELAREAVAALMNYVEADRSLRRAQSAAADFGRRARATERAYERGEVDLTERTRRAREALEREQTLGEARVTEAMRRARLVLMLGGGERGLPAFLQSYVDQLVTHRADVRSLELLEEIDQTRFVSEVAASTEGVFLEARGYGSAGGSDRPILEIEASARYRRPAVGGLSPTAIENISGEMLLRFSPLPAMAHRRVSVAARTDREARALRDEMARARIAAEGMHRRAHELAGAIELRGRFVEATQRLLDREGISCGGSLQDNEAPPVCDELAAAQAGVQHLQWQLLMQEIEMLEAIDRSIVGRLEQ